MSASSWRCLSRPCVPATAAAARSPRGLLFHPVPAAHPRRRQLLTLAIESSCDDTCVAVLEKPARGAPGGGTARLHFNEKITSDNRDYRGVHPLTAAVSHTAHVGPLVRRALRALPEVESAQGTGADGQEEEKEGEERRRMSEVVWVDGTPRRKPDFVAVTRGPGMTSNLATGLATAKGLAVAWDVPLLGVNHMQAHALTPRLVSALGRTRKKAGDGDGSGAESGKDQEGGDADNPAFPFLSLLVSGGHTLLVHSRSLTSHAILAQADNIAIGDMMDKCARIIMPSAYLEAASSPSPSAGGGSGTVMYGALLERFVFPHTGQDTSNGHVDYDYGYAPPAARAREIEPFDSGRGWVLTPPLAGTTRMAYDFSGFYSQVQRAVEAHIAPRYAASASSGAVEGGPEEEEEEEFQERRLLGRHAMRLAFEHLVSRVLFALRDLGAAGKGIKARRKGKEKGKIQEKEEEGQKRNESGIKDEGATSMTTTPEAEAGNSDGNGDGKIQTLVVSGGVASNGYLMHILRTTLAARGHGDVRVVSPPPALCTDNAAMIAWAGAEMYEAGWRSALDVLPLRKWPLDPEAEGGGILGAEGWYKV